MADQTPEKIIQVGLGFWSSKTLLSAIELGLFTELARKPGDLADLRARLGPPARSAHDCLDPLAAMGFLERGRATSRNTAATDFFLDRGKPSYIGGLLEMANRRLDGFSYHVTTAL